MLDFWKAPVSGHKQEHPAAKTLHIKGQIKMVKILKLLISSFIISPSVFALCNSQLVG